MNLIPLRGKRLKCLLSPMGASLVELKVLTRCGDWRQVLLSPLSHREGIPEPALAGCTVAPCCGRVRDAEMTLAGKTYRLDANEGSNHLHGGFRSASGLRWSVIQSDARAARFALDLPDGEGGYPGNRRLEVSYIIEEDALTVGLSAATDALSWFCMTNHAYWDLTGRFDGSAMDQRLTVPASRAVFNDDRHLPESIRAVEGTPFDFRAPVSPAEMMARFPDHPQIKIARGFNNALLIDPDAPHAARLSAPDGSLSMTLDTDYPALVFYSGGFLGKETLLPTGPAVLGAALALEAQSPPDPFHLPGVAPELLRPGEHFRRFIRWRFE